MRKAKLVAGWSFQPPGSHYRKRGHMDPLILEIRAERIRQGLSQKQLGLKARTAENWVYQLESGRHSPTLSTLRKIADVLGLDIVLMRKRG